MLKKLVLSAAALGIGLSAIAPLAEAEVVWVKRKHGHGYFEPYYPGPYDAPPPGYYAYGNAPGEPLYYDYMGRPVFDEGYYNPYYLPPSKKKLRALRRARARAAAIEAAQQAEAAAQTKSTMKTPARTASAKPVTSKSTDTVTTGSISKTQTASAARSAPGSEDISSKPGAVSCDKATSIVSGYGFGTVKANDCKGQVYEFSAVRDGKNFLIKVSSASGELTEVKKLN